MSMQLRCEDCGRLADEDARGWRGYLGIEDLGDEEFVLIFCPACSEREFGPAGRRRTHES